MTKTNPSSHGRAGPNNSQVAGVIGIVAMTAVRIIGIVSVGCMRMVAQSMGEVSVMQERHRVRQAAAHAATRIAQARERRRQELLALPKRELIALLRGHYPESRANVFLNKDGMVSALLETEFGQDRR
jgi:hypothetical protein